MKSRCWKPSKSVFRFLGCFDASQIDFLTIFNNFSSKMLSEMDPKINQKSMLEAIQERVQSFGALGIAPNRFLDGF